VLVLHGFTGDPSSVRGLGEALAAAGHAVELPRLPGHGTTVEDMVPTRWADWSAEAEAALERLEARSEVEQVVVAGLSMGGTLSLWLAERHPEVAGLVLVNPLVTPPDPAVVDLLRGLLEEGVEVAPGVGSDIARPGVTESAYPGSPVRAALSLFEATGEVSGALDRLRCPVLLLQSRVDHVVAPESGERLVSALGDRCRRVWLERSYHVATLDFDAELVEREATAFVASLAAASGGGASGS